MPFVFVLFLAAKLALMMEAASALNPALPRTAKSKFLKESQHLVIEGSKIEGHRGYRKEKSDNFVFSVLSNKSGYRRSVQ